MALPETRGVVSRMRGLGFLAGTLTSRLLMKVTGGQGPTRADGHQPWGRGGGTGGGRGGGGQHIFLGGDSGRVIVREPAVHKIDLGRS